MFLQLPFASKELPDGRKIFRRKRGYTTELISGQTVLDVVVPVSVAKINEGELIWFPEGVTCTMQVLDTDTGTISGIPNKVLNEFVTDAVVAKDYFIDKSPYDADVIGGMKIRFIFNYAGAPKLVGVNMVFHQII